jgi:hypothetical protein
MGRLGRVHVVWHPGLPGLSACYPGGGDGEAGGGVTGKYGGVRGQLPSWCPGVHTVNPRGGGGGEAGGWEASCS